MAFFLAFLRESVRLWVQMSPYLLLGMLIGGALHVMLREEFILRHLGGRSSSSVFKATLFGIPLPLCSCGVIPVAASLRRDGASKGATLAFLVSTPTTGVDSILATYSLLGPLFAFFRPLAALLAGLVVGLSSLFVVKEERWQGHRHPLPSRQPVPERLKEGLRYGLLELSRDIGGWLLLGVIVGGALSALVPEGAFRSLGVHPLWESLALLALSIPLYVCATGSIPVAAALIAKGISPGAALVFLVAGPATNTVTIGFVYSQLGKRASVIYVASILFISLLLGWVLNALWQALGAPPELVAPKGGLLPTWLRVGAGVILLGLVLYTQWEKRRTKDVSGMKYTFYVPGMSCQHCKAKMEGALKALKGVEEVSVDLEKKAVGVEGKVSREEIEEALRRVGYPPAEGHDT